MVHWEYTNLYLPVSLLKLTSERELGYMYHMLWGTQDGICKRPKEQTLEEEGHVCRQTESKAAR